MVQFHQTHTSLSASLSHGAPLLLSTASSMPIIVNDIIIIFDTFSIILYCV
jgi:hypothetical protein